MILSIYQIDAFTNSVFGGNPAAVVPLEDWLDDRLLLQIAKENNLSETAFFTKADKRNVHYHLRWFTPGGEIDLCGHATLATAYLIKRFLGFQSSSIVFSTEKAGLLRVNCGSDGFELDFPEVKTRAIPVPEDLAEILGISPLSLEATLLGRDLMVVVNHEEQVRAAKPDMTRLLQFPGTGVLLTAKGKKYDVVGRCFYPKMQINEDPVTGSAHCHIVPYWSKKLKQEKLKCAQASERFGELLCQYNGKRVLMQGNAVLYLHGTIYV